jgi:hypothetical protein
MKVGALLKVVEASQFWLNSDKNYMHFTKGLPARLHVSPA